MRVMTFTAYGGPEVLQLDERPDPEPRAGEVVVKVAATTVTAGDCELRRSDLPAMFWLPLRLFVGLTRPRRGRDVLGQELAGVVEAVGQGVTELAEGDRVFGPTDMDFGAYADKARLPAKLLAKAPAGVPLEDLAPLGMGGINGLCFVRAAELREGARLLIVGAGGSIGTYALQLAKAEGAEVTVVDRGDKLAMLAELGADHVIAYDAEEWWRREETYDAIIEVCGKTRFGDCVRRLAPKGRLVITNLRMNLLARSRWLRLTSDRSAVSPLASSTPEDLAYLAERVAEGALRTIVDQTVTLAQLPEAHRHVERGDKAGNLLVVP